MSDDIFQNQEQHGTSENGHGEHGHHHRRKVRKRIRIKKKSGPKRKIKKVIEKLIWIIIIGSFIATLVIMMKQLDIKDESLKKKKSTFYCPVKIYYEQILLAGSKC